MKEFIAPVVLFLLFSPMLGLAHEGTDSFSHHGSSFGMMGFLGGYSFFGIITVILFWIFLLVQPLQLMQQ